MQRLNPEGVHNWPLYDLGIKTGNTVYTSGCVPLDSEGNVVAPNDPAYQTQVVMEVLKLILAEGGGTLQDVVYMHTYYLREEDSLASHEVRLRYLGQNRPAHTASVVSRRSWVECHRSDCLKADWPNWMDRQGNKRRALGALGGKTGISWSGLRGRE